jgi:hypothetical protein
VQQAEVQTVRALEQAVRVLAQAVRVLAGRQWVPRLAEVRAARQAVAQAVRVPQVARPVVPQVARPVVPQAVRVPAASYTALTPLLAARLTACHRHCYLPIVRLLNGHHLQPSYRLPLSSSWLHCAQTHPFEASLLSRL